MSSIISPRVIGALFLAILLLYILNRGVPSQRFRDLPRLCLPLASAIFWGILATVLVITVWDSYYAHFVPAWSRWLAPLASLTYFLIGSLLRWISLKLKGQTTLIFVLLGGLESIPEHYWGIYDANILEIPMLVGTNPWEIFVFAFFEYIVYWSLVVGLAIILDYIWRSWRKSRGADEEIPGL
jgi:uncharacterized membrane protein